MQTVKRKCQVHLIQVTEKAQDCFILHNNILSFNNEYFTNFYLKSISASAYHLYITSDDEIKEGDWLFIESKGIIQATSMLLRDSSIKKDKKGKIIATTDKLILNNLTHIPQPSLQFIRIFVDEYNRKNVIKEVMVEYYKGHINVYKESVPTDCKVDYFFETGEFSGLKVNPKDNTITIRKIKDNWSREEVANILRNFKNDILVEVSNGTVSDFTEKWIEKNL